MGETSQFGLDDASDPGGKLRVLFVDDDANILGGLRRLLRSERSDWEMRFANGPEEALSMLDEEPANVVVSDLRMPVMDGAELLGRIQERWPRTIRLILSGHGDEAEVMKTVGPAHQFLAKPCDAGALKGAIKRAASLRVLLGNRRLAEIAGGVAAIPALPENYQALRSALLEENVGIDRIAAIVGRDPGMTAQILKLVNSAFFGLRQEVTDVAQAVNILGLETIHALVLNHQAIAVLAEGDCRVLDLEELTRHNLAVAVALRDIVEAEGRPKEQVDAAFVAGMLHDLGKLILATRLPDRFAAVIASSRKHEVPTHRAEREVFHADHAELGGYLLGLWGLVDPIVEAVALHHQPGRLPVGDPLLLTALHVVESVTGAASDPDATVDKAFLETSPYYPRLRDWVAVCRHQGDDET